MGSVIDIISGIFTGGTTAIALKLGLGVFLLVVVWFAGRWLDKKLKAAAHEKTQKGRADSQSKIDDENKTIFDDANKSEDDLEEIIRKRRGNK